MTPFQQNPDDPLSRLRRRAADPAAGEGPLAEAEVRFWRWEDDAWHDVSSEFGDPDPDIQQDDMLCEFWVRPPGEEDPAPAGKLYGISVQVDAPDGQVIYGDWPLCLLGDAS